MNTLIFDNIIIRNFLSTGNFAQAINLNIGGLTHVAGRNSDIDSESAANGVGKSTILQAISYAIWGKALTKIKVPNLVNHFNNKNMSVVLNFHCGDTYYRIERGQKPNFLKFFINNSEIKENTANVAQGENRHTLEDIERIIGMSHDMFKIIMALNTFSDPFLKMNTKDQRILIEELFGMVKITKKAETLSSKMKTTKNGIIALESAYNATVEANKRIERMIEQTEHNGNNWEKDRSNRIKKIDIQLEKLSLINIEDELSIFDSIDIYDQSLIEIKNILDIDNKELSFLTKDYQRISNECSKYQNDLSQSGSNSIDRLKKELERKERHLNQQRRSLTDLEDKLVSVSADFENADTRTCMTCHQPLSGTDHLDLVKENIQKEIAHLKQQKNTLEKDIIDSQSEIEHIKHDIEDEQKDRISKLEIIKTNLELSLTKKNSLEIKIQELKTKIKETEDIVTDLGDRPRSTFRNRDEIYETRQKREILSNERTIEERKANPYLMQIDGLLETIQPVDIQPIEDARKLYNHQEFLFKLLTSKDSFVRKRIIEQNLYYLNSRLAFYLNKLGLPHLVQFDSDLTVEITHLGRDVDYEQLSRGQMNRVNLATSWAFRDIWERLNISINLLCIDEIIDQGMDDHGASAAVDILKSMATERNKDVILISHRKDLVSKIDHVLTVELLNGFTQFS